jgi:hypothetical protein
VSGFLRCIGGYLSFPRKRKSSVPGLWRLPRTPAFAGVMSVLPPMTPYAPAHARDRRHVRE